MTETTKRIIELQKQKKVKTYPLEMEAGLPISSIQAWVNGKKRKDGKVSETSPSADAIAKLARYFNVSADYLLCLTDEPAPLNVANIIERPIATLSPVLAELSSDKEFVNAAKLYNAVSAEYKRQICAYILGVASALDVNISQVLGR